MVSSPAPQAGASANSATPADRLHRMQDDVTKRGPAPEWSRCPPPFPYYRKGRSRNTLSGRWAVQFLRPSARVRRSGTIERLTAGTRLRTAAATNPAATTRYLTSGGLRDQIDARTSASSWINRKFLRSRWLRNSATELSGA